ncbi:MAG: nucleoside triphosphate pyrophosphohydrolase [Ignavibacteriales bacterium]|nr:MAG: nucleoside triphosphate pyrophosphohydrolase [Ignavibacteriales bacterium]
MSEVKFNEFIAIVKRLRKECPWDREQTNDSIKANTLEEAYEVVHAIDEGNYSELKKELGDLLLHVVFHTIMAEEKKEFTIDDVIDSITEKLIRRHPHVFGETEVSGSSEVKKNWETIKLAEGRTSLLEGIPSDLPALLKAHRIQEKASKVGFDWSHKDEVWKKVTEEISELHEAEEKGNKEKTEEEFGDLLFALANYSRFIHVNPEDALRKSTAKFIRRFRYIEDELRKKDIPLPEAGLKLMDELWEESKKKEVS